MSGQALRDLPLENNDEIAARLQCRDDVDVALESAVTTLAPIGEDGLKGEQQCSFCCLGDCAQAGRGLTRDAPRWIGYVFASIESID